MRKITFWLTLVLIFTIPFEDSLSFGTKGTSLTRLLGLGVAGFWFLTIMIEGRFRKFKLFHAFVLFFFLWNVLSYVWTVDLAATYEHIQTYLQIFILLVIMWEMLQEPEELNAGIQAYIFGAFVPIFSALNNYLHGVSSEQWEARYSATGVNAVDLVMFLLIAIPAAWHLYSQVYQRKKILRLIDLAFIPLAIFTVLLTASRTSLFAIVPAAIFILWPKKMSLANITLTVMAVLISFAILLAVLPASVTDRLSSVATSISSADIGGRVNLWLETFNVFLQHPLLGSGSGTLTTVIGSFAHETFLSVLAETGLIGFALFCLVLWHVFLQIRKLPKGQTGLWLSTFFVWLMGVLSLSFEFRKLTWVFFSFMILEGNAIRKKLSSQRVELAVPAAKETQPLGNFSEIKKLNDQA